MDKSILITELNAINAARVNRMRVADLVMSNKDAFLPLLQIVFDVKNKTSVKAAWVLEFVVQRKLNWLLQYMDYFTENIPKIKNGSAVRPIAKVCEIFALYLDKNPSDKEKYQKNIDQIIETSFDWMLSDHKIAIKVYTMQTLFLFGKDQPWIYPELKIILENNLAKESFGYRNRALKILNKIA